MSSNWYPGCGKPHPDFDTIMQWASGQLREVIVERPGCHPIKQHHPCWSEQHKHRPVHKQEWTRMFRDEEDNLRLATAEDRSRLLAVERLVYEQYGTVTWLHQDWVLSVPTKMTRKLGEHRSRQSLLNLDMQTITIN